MLSLFVAGAAVSGTDEGSPEQPRARLSRGRRRAAGARALAEPQHQRGRSDRRAHHPRGARARGEPRRAGRGLAQERDVVAPQPARQAERLHQPDERRQRALHRRRRFGRRIGQAGTRPRAAGDPAACAARCSTPKARRWPRCSKTRSCRIWSPRSAAGSGRTSSFARLRYGKVIILADADSDGNHIATLLLTFIYRHLPQLITNGHVFLAQPPLYRIDIGKETLWALDDAQKDADPEAARQEWTRPRRRPRSPGSRASGR